MTDNRRQHSRITLRVDVDVASGSNFYAGKTRDLSLGGIFVELPMSLEVGTDVSITLVLGKARFTIAARCAWVLTGPDGGAIGFGAEFVTLPPRVRRAILAFMKSREPMAFDLLEELPDDDDEAEENEAEAPTEPAADAAHAPEKEPGGGGRGGPPPLPVS